MVGQKTPLNLDNTKTTTTLMLKLPGHSGITIMPLDTLPKMHTMDKLDSTSWKMIRRTLLDYHLATTMFHLLLQLSDTTLMVHSGILRPMERPQVSSVMCMLLFNHQC